MAGDPDHAAAGEVATATDAGESPIITLPAIVAPNISASQDEVKDKAPDGTAAAATPARSKRFAMLAASVAFAAAFGFFRRFGFRLGIGAPHLPVTLAVRDAGGWKREHARRNARNQTGTRWHRCDQSEPRKRHPQRDQPICQNCRSAGSYRS